MVFSQKMFDWHRFDTTKTTYQLHIGKDFPGVVRKAKINARAYVENHENTLLVNTDSTKCRKQGSSKCNFCDKQEITGIIATPYDCFTTCPDFGYYVDASGNC